MFALLRQRGFALLWTGGLISAVGDWVLFVALPFYVYQRTGSTLATGATFMAQILPPLLLGSVAGVFVDRWDRRRTMIIADLARALLLLLLLTVHTRADLPRVYIVAFLLAAITQFFGPAKGALIPRLVGTAHLVRANALNALGDNIPRLVGPALGGVLFAGLGLPGVVLTDSASFLFSGVLILFIRVPPAETAEAGAVRAPQTHAAWMAFWHEWRDGLRLVGMNRVLRTLFTVEGLAVVGQGILDVLFLPYVKRVLHGDALLFGWLLSLQAIGGLLGGMIAGRISVQLSPTRLFGLSMGLVGATIVIAANVPILPLIVPLVALVGIPVVGWLVGAQTVLQDSVADRYRGRMLGTYGTTSALTQLGGMGLAGVLGDRLGIVPMLNISGGLHIVGGVGALILLHTARSVRTPADDLPVGTG
jgi:MFS family permease